MVPPKNRFSVVLEQDHFINSQKKAGTRASTCDQVVAGVYVNIHLAEIRRINNWCTKSTISRVLRQESQLREESVLKEGQAGTFKIQRDWKDLDVEEALDQWFSILSGKGKAKSEELDTKLGRTDFNSTDGWLSRWKARHNIKFKKAHDEKKNVALYGYKKAINRITVLCCTNMSGKSARLRCFTGLRMERLPVEYHANKNA
ncbi:hypothetical protein RF11_12744 [Thelohanellus kitauei]|uniref:HTH CENPB-type domain-containing protein n=1 Tax=Thelohanellus kitauei TaxID=669202 RepID=A0A0C2M2M0_THEKT|nr:hypothetical protein RF11_12744 [Thelohanellus kitauei]